MSSLDVIKKILINEMQIDKTRIWAYNSNIDLPKDNDLFIVLHYGERTPISNTVKYKTTQNGLNEVQSMNVAENVVVSVMSRNNDSRDRAPEVLMAMNSTFARQQQAKNKMHISILGDVLDNSFLEATSRFNRFDCLLRVFVSFDKIKAVEYYDKFPNTADFEAEYYFDN